MRHTSSNRRPRQRKRSNSRGGQQGRTRVYDSNGPDVRIRGTAHQVAEKYEALAKDAKASGDFSMAQNYLQHAEHYVRIINDLKPKHDVKVDRSDAGAEASADNQISTDKQEDAVVDDLALPASILGKEMKVESEEVPVTA